jgi:hypothetical protein
MPWSFRKSLKLGPGIRLNLGKKSASRIASIQLRVVAARPIHPHTGSDTENGYKLTQLKQEGMRWDTRETKSSHDSRSEG